MGEMVTMLVLWLVVIGVMWFLLMRPQKKEQKRIQQMLASMEVGDTALTTSGFYGVIIDITDEDVIVEFGNNKNCRIPMQKAAIAQIEKTECRLILSQLFCIMRSGRILKYFQNSP